MKPAELYARRQAAYGKLQGRQQRLANRLSNLRLYTLVLGLVFSFVIYQRVNPTMGWLIAGLTLLAFIFLALRHGQVKARLRYVQALVAANDRGAARVAGRWGAFADAGAEFADAEHPYATDLDLFGQGSLFQRLNFAQTFLGRVTLAEWLKRGPHPIAEIRERQQAVAELAGLLTWRQRFEAEGQLVRDHLEPATPLIEWGAEVNSFYLRPFVKLGLRALPLLTAFVGTLYLVSKSLPWQLPALLVALQVLLLRVNGKQRAATLSLVYRQAASLRTYARLLARFEQQPFRSEWLTRRQRRLLDKAGRAAHEQVQRLAVIADRISNRENGLFIIVNILTLWDYQGLIALEAWKQESGKRLAVWLETLGEVEALASLAGLRFEEPDWVFPQLDEGAGGLDAKGVGHPLITKNRVVNDFKLPPASPIVVLTGSNMSGKSTFLRTIGINLVLAYSGAPVCAKAFRCSMQALWTSMRHSDNLERNISSFYAELLRIKRIVEAAKAGEPVFFLLDEIFKGTNSRDRHQGAKALVHQLQRDGAFGLISTHDLELGQLEQASQGRIKNYHFREHYEGGEIRFDYILRPGVSTTRNAMYLIQMMGVDVGGGDHP